MMSQFGSVDFCRQVSADDSKLHGEFIQATRSESLSEHSSWAGQGIARTRRRRLFTIGRFHFGREKRARRQAEGLAKHSYTTFIIDSIARALRDHPKLNRLVFLG